jgi:hypothetical protein
MQRVRDEQGKAHREKQRNLVSALKDEATLWITEDNLDKVGILFSIYTQSLSKMHIGTQFTGSFTYTLIMVKVR